MAGVLERYQFRLFGIFKVPMVMFRVVTRYVGCGGLLLLIRDGCFIRFKWWFFVVVVINAMICRFGIVMIEIVDCPGGVEVVRELINGPHYEGTALFGHFQGYFFLVYCLK